LTIWHFILSAELTKNALLQTVFFRLFFGDCTHWDSIPRFEKQQLKASQAVSPFN